MKQELQEFSQDYKTVDALFSRTIEFLGTAEYIRFFQMLSKITHYSNYNSLLVYLQNPKVLLFGTPGYWWEKFNRRVKQNARPYIILAPFQPVVIAYDLEETEGEQSPEEIIEATRIKKFFEVKGDFNQVLLDCLIDKLNEYNIEINFKYFNHNKGGETIKASFDKIIININKSLKSEEMFGVLIHELAHNFLGHLGEKVLTRKTILQKGKNKGKERIETKKIEYRKVSDDVCEIEAESVAYLLCLKMGLEMDPKFYLSAHLDSNNRKIVSITKIVSTADFIQDTFLQDFFR